MITDLKILNVAERDIDVLLKTLPAFADKEMLDRKDLKNAFEKATIEAQEKVFFS